MSKEVVEVTGFKQLARQITRLEDSLKRKELLKVQRLSAESTVRAARALITTKGYKHTRDNLGPGNLKKSITKRAGKKSKTPDQAVLYVGPRLVSKKTQDNLKKKGKSARADGWYAHFVEAGTARGIKPKRFMARAYAQTKGQVTADLEKKTAKALQRQINRLSKN